METFTLLFGPVGPELLVILALLVLLFGANRIPEMARAVGSSLGEFKKGRKEIEEELANRQESTMSEATSTSSMSDSTGGITMTTSSDSPTTTDTDGQSSSSTETPSRSTRSLESVKGIGPTYSERLKEAGIQNVGDLADSNATTVASAANVSESVSQKWVHAAEALVETN